ncbi:MAG: type II secretion system F family protein [Pirellulales bacterium]
MSLTILIPVVTFIAFGAVAWFLMDMFANKPDRTEERLEILKDPRRARAKGEKKSETLTRMLKESAPKLAAPLTPKSEAELSRLKQELISAGFRSEYATVMFTAIRSLCAIGFMLIGGLGSLVYYGVNTGALIGTLVAGGIGLMLPTFALGFLANRRKQQIFLGLPDALDLLVVCVEAGLGLDQAMRRVADEMKKSWRTLGEEFSLCNLHLQMGRQRNQVLQDLGSRTGVDDLRSLASILIQADKFGSSVANALRVQSDAMRLRRQQIAEEKAAKTAVKLIFPLVFFIFPGIFVVLVGPAGIQMAREMLPAMAAGG